MLLRLPFAREIAAALAKGLPLLTHQPAYRPVFNELYQTIGRHSRGEALAP